MSENKQEEVMSPCIGVCTVDEDSGFCLGCYRTVDEIQGWWDMQPEAQKNLLAVLEERQLQQVNFD